MQKWIIVPEGLSATTKTNCNEPSFVYKAVLDWAIVNCKKNDIVYLAPANTFGGLLAEDEVAEEYLKRANVNFKINSIKGLERNTYIDTFGNAAVLKRGLSSEDFRGTHLICGKYHQLRSYLCFRAHGFDITKVIGVSYRKKEQPRIVNRLFFYHIAILHFTYECLATVRDAARILHMKLISK